jgi:CheY-like chemotaxis protein
MDLNKLKRRFQWYPRAREFPLGKYDSTAPPAVLVVEDEPLLRLFAVDMVEDAGFEAFEAAGSNEALRILAGPHDIRLVFTDIDMPDGVNGLCLAGMVRERWPLIKIIVTSGKRAPLTEGMPAGSLFFSKPYDPDEVTATMRRMTR